MEMVAQEQKDMVTVTIGNSISAPPDLGPSG
jgi:hypothetical protein